MRDIDIWANSVNELEHGLDMSEFISVKQQPTSLADYSRLTPNKLISKMNDAIKSYDRDFHFKFIDMKTGKQFRNVCLKIDVDDVSEEVNLYFDFK